MTDKIKLDIVSDVVCPWCIIGYKRVAQAITGMGLEDRIEVEWHPFELNPDMPPEGEEVHAHIGRKYGTTQDECIRTLAQMTELGAELGFKFDYFDGFKMVNTRDLHILLEYAKESNKQTELKMRLFEAFFSEHKDVSDRQILTQEIQHVGLNESKALARLDDDTFRNQVQAQEAYLHSLGISAVPTMIFNNSSVLTGAQPVDVYKEVLTEIVEH
ncbi:MAG: DsbA family oxidoreductase [Desulfocapsaceae bacterium]